MATKILENGQMLVRRPNRTEQLSIRAGAFDYDELIQRAEQKVAPVEAAAMSSSLPNRSDVTRINQILVELRTVFYRAW